ncbi:MAG TPA: Sjogren's syndrome/scleroderma autoantigen 1 family protein [Candidatus Bathyarchaeia archaeon]|nr:Sjogren's syndrome/scleroderma autoantigen 1 family protein [Candidatus Bathyarchaeia archaeon]
MSRERHEDQEIKRMADLLRQGSTLTDLACPACSSPLFKLKNGDLWCAKCEKKVLVVKDGEEATRMSSTMALESIETTLLAKVQELQEKIKNTSNAEELQKLGATLSGLLENIEKIRKVKRA